MNHKDKINAYYDQTDYQYRRVWQLDKHKGIHYGYWDESTKNLISAVIRMNEVMAEIADFTSKSRILDMGCGIGGSMFHLIEKFNSTYTGINLNSSQIDKAKAIASENGLTYKTNFINDDYLNSNLPSNSFEGIWAQESICHCEKKSDFVKEAYRLLAPGGVLVLSEYFLNQEEYNTKTAIKNWIKKWSIPNLDSLKGFKQKLVEEGFKIEVQKDISKNIYKSSLFMFLAAFPGMFSTEIDQLIKDRGPYYHKHYRSAFWQFIALKQNLWSYHIIKAVKPEN